MIWPLKIQLSDEIWQKCYAYGPMAMSDGTIILWEGYWWRCSRLEATGHGIAIGPPYDQRYLEIPSKPQ
jgi:hypothetical protein